jgi:predicted ATPase/DNA-binding SARP family transcriptional activator
MARLSLFFLGGFEARLDDIPISGLKTDKARALLAYLAMEQDRPHRRQALAGLFWPGYLESSARASLRHALANLRQVLLDDESTAPCLLIEGETIQLNPDADIWVDVRKFEAAIGDQGAAISEQQSAINNLQSSIALYRGGFLEGFTLKDCPEFDTWTGIVREELQGKALMALDQLAGEYERQGELEKACQYTRRQLELEPALEEAHRQLMRMLALRGQRTAALAQYETCKRNLAEQLGVEPSAETTRLFEQIRAEEAGTVPGATRADQVPAEPAPLIRLQPRPKHNLPIQLTSFIGREKEIAAVTRLLQEARLVTLTGPGGTGKTRLALRVAGDLLDEYEDGVWLVELAPLSEPALVPAIAARSLGLRELTEPQVISLLQEYLEHRHLLLIFDNCEHVIEACARLAEALLQTCPKLSILVSSREALGITGEVSFRVPPLALPEARQMPSLEELAQYEAIRLFVERAAAVQTTAASPGFTLTPANAPAILQVCQRLDGIPLAIELAAARVKLLQVTEIAQRLDDRFRLLTGGSRLALPRHQTLRASIDWSYELLSPAERSLLQHLSVFAGGWTLEGAEAVGCGEDIQACDVLELLGHLVDKSLIQTSNVVAGLYRFRMLETIRQYAHEKLVEAGQAEEARERHLKCYLELVERLEKVIRGPDQVRIQERLETELDNLRLALAWSLEGKGQPGWDPEPGLRLAAALHWFWYFRGREDEGVQWLELLLAGELEERGSKPLTPERIKCRAKALLVAAFLAYIIGELAKTGKLSDESCELYQSLGVDGRLGYAYARTYIVSLLDIKERRKELEECLAIFRAEGDRFGMAESLYHLGIIAIFCKEYEKAKGYYEDMLALRKEIGDLDGIAWSYLLLGLLAYAQGKGEPWRAMIEESQGLYSKNHNENLLGVSHLSFGELEIYDGNYAQAAAHCGEGLSIGRRLGSDALIFRGLLGLGWLALVQGNSLEAAERFEEDLAYFRKKDNTTYIAYSLYALGMLAWAIEESEQASRMYTDALIQCRAGGDTYCEATILCGLGKVAIARGEFDQAKAQFEQAFKIKNLFHYINLDPHEPAILTLEATATLVATQGQMEQAARLLGATEVEHKKVFYGRLPRERQEREACVSTVRLAMGAEAFAAAWAQGQAMTAEQAVEYAKGLIHTLPPSTSPER